MKISEYPKISTLDDEQVFIVDGGYPTSQISVKDVASTIGGSGSGGGNIIVNEDDRWIYHRNTYRGKNLGNQVTENQLAAIRNGSFTDLFVGDYWRIANHNWRIADINYWNKSVLTKNHLVIIPDDKISTNKINSTTTLSGGYLGTDFAKTTINTIANTVKSYFPNMILTHKERLSNAYRDEMEKGSIEIDVELCLLSERLIFNDNFFVLRSNNGSISFEARNMDPIAFSLFVLNPSMIYTSNDYIFLRDLCTNNTICALCPKNLAEMTQINPTQERGIRPYFLIG